MSKVAIALLSLAFLAGSSAEPLPTTPGETLAGGKLEFPTALAGKPVVCIFGFSKEAGDKTKVWMSKLNESGVNAWSVAELEAAPALVRGMIRSSMRKGTPQPLLERSVILTKDDKAWRQAVGSKNDKLPVVVVLDAKGQIVWTFEGVSNDESLRELKTKLEAGTP